MTEDFDRFSEMVERQCALSWRTAIGRDAKDAVRSVNSVLFTREEKGGTWSMTFQLRSGKRWNMASVDMKPVRMDEMDVAPGEPGPAQRAALVAMDLAQRAAEEVKKNWHL